jgi:glyoxylase-like metal-dependent hydrolase (beta-lactamase superfamily II)
MKITDNVNLIDGTMANCYDVHINDVHILVDAGTKNSAKKIISYYNQMKSSPDYVLITHYHPDHIGGLKLILDNFKSDVFVPDAEVDVVLGKAKMIPAKTILSKIVSRMMKVEPVKDVKKASEIHMNGITVIETPGHTPGSTSYYFEKDGVIFVGDAITNKSGVPTINKGFTLDMKQAEKSKALILEKKPSIVLAGHGKPLINR